jgi:hypothetical protein
MGDTPGLVVEVELEEGVEPPEPGLVVGVAPPDPTLWSPEVAVVLPEVTNTPAAPATPTITPALRTTIAALRAFSHAPTSLSIPTARRSGPPWA